MNINNPTTFGSPNLTLTTSNSSGTGGALRSDDSILVYDTTGPAAVAASAGVGSAATSARRDHVHAGIAAITSTDEAIARYSGTAGALQNYSSLAPTISDAGIVSLTSGALKWPATVIASSDANTLDDYEEGSFTPIAKDGSGNAAGTSAAVGRYTRIGNIVSIQLEMTVNTLSGVTTSDSVTIYGLPFTALAVAGTSGSVVASYGTDMALAVVGAYPTGQVEQNTATLLLRVWDSTGGITGFLFSELTAAGVLQMGGTYRV